MQNWTLNSALGLLGGWILLFQMAPVALAQPYLEQASFRFENDNGPGVDDNSAQATVDTGRTDVRRGERLTIRIRVDNTGTASASNVYRLQYDRNDDLWVDVDIGPELRPSLGIAGSGGEPLLEPRAAPCQGDFVPGSWWHGIASTAPITLEAGQCTELAFVLHTAGALPAEQYRLRLWNVTDDAPLDEYVALPSLTVETAPALRYSKQTGLAAVLDTLHAPAGIPGDGFGRSVASADFDADGYWGIVAGAPGDDTLGGNVGRVFLLQRSAGDTGFVTTYILDDPTPTGADKFGSSVVVGDFNDDGRPDVLVGAPGHDPGGGFINVGQVYVFIQNDTGSGFESPVILDDPTPSSTGQGDSFGSSMAACDVNADGADDVIVGGPGDGSLGSNVGQVYLFLRNAGNNGFVAPMIFDSPTFAPGSEGDRFGTSVACADVNQDGFADVIAGAPLDATQGTNVGQAYVLVRNENNDGFNPAQVIDHPSPTVGDNFGVAVAAGDMNGDGRADLLVGAHLDDTHKPDQGRAYVFLRSADNMRFDAAIALDAPEATAGAWFGSSVSVGDVDNDGRADAIIGAPAESTIGAGVGRVYFFDQISSLLTENDFEALDDPTVTAGDQFGVAMTLGDVNDDGMFDLIVGAPADDSVTADAGQVILFDRRPGRDAHYYLDERGYDATIRIGTLDAQWSLAGPPVFVFAARHENNSDPIRVRWEGFSTVATWLRPLRLEVLRRSAATTWEEIALDATGDANEGRVLSSLIETDANQYYDASFWTIWRVYQEPGLETLFTDGFVVSFGYPDTPPSPATGVTLTDEDENPGVDGRDFTLTWTDPADLSDVVHFELFLLPAPARLALDLDTPIGVGTSSIWRGTTDITIDSLGQPLTNRAYRAYVVSVDASGNRSPSEPSADMTPSPDFPDTCDQISCPPATGVTLTDEDDHAGIDGRDFTVTWGPPMGLNDITHFAIFLLPVPARVILGLDTAIDVEETGSSWQGAARMTSDSIGEHFAEVPYRAFVVVADARGNQIVFGPSAEMTPSPDAGGVAGGGCNCSTSSIRSPPSSSPVPFMLLLFLSAGLRRLSKKRRARGPVFRRRDPRTLAYIDIR